MPPWSRLDTMTAFRLFYGVAVEISTMSIRDRAGGQRALPASAGVKRIVRCGGAVRGQL
jgi:hypothetical protein